MNKDVTWQFQEEEDWMANSEKMLNLSGNQGNTN